MYKLLVQGGREEMGSNSFYPHTLTHSSPFSFLFLQEEEEEEGHLVN